jgi:hypothetical protein
MEYLAVIVLGATLCIGIVIGWCIHPLIHLYSGKWFLEYAQRRLEKKKLKDREVLERYQQYWDIAQNITRPPTNTSTNTTLNIAVSGSTFVKKNSISNEEPQIDQFKTLFNEHLEHRLNSENPTDPYIEIIDRQLKLYSQLYSNNKPEKE